MRKRHSFALLLTLSLLLTGCLRRPDALAPIVTIVEPQSGTIQDAQDLSIRGYAMDDEGIDAIRVNGVDLLQDPVYQAQHSYGLIHFAFRPQRVSQGQWVSHIEVEDVNGRITTLEFPLQIDATVPTIELREISSLSGNRLLVSGVARDNGQIGRIQVNDIELSFVSTSEKPFSVTIPASSTVTITVADEAGNETVETFNP